MKTIFVITSILFLSGCAGKQISDCSTVQQESVSQCRAEAVCGKGKWSTGMGFVMSGMGAGSSGKNLAVENYSSCVDRDLDAQRSNAGIQSTVLNCQTKDLGDGISKTTCH